MLTHAPTADAEYSAPMASRESRTAEPAPAPDAATALALDFLHPDREPNAVEVTRDGVALLTALEGQHDARFVLQTTCVPDPERPERGTLDIHLIVVHENGGAERRAELLDDIQDLLAAPPLRWSFSATPPGEESAKALDPFEVRHFAEVARREEPCAPTDWALRVGFTGKPGARRTERDLWSMWTLGSASPDLRRLAAVFLAQEAPVCMRVMLKPTELTVEERSALEELQMEVNASIGGDGLQRASLGTLEALLYVRPLFHVSCVVASPSPLSRSLLSAIGHAVSEPAPHGLPQPILQGGFAVMRPEDEDARRRISDDFDAMRPVHAASSIARPPLGRLRRLMGPWEAANVFRIPVAQANGLPGFDTIGVPPLDPPVGRLPKRGTRVGALIGHGGLPVHIEDEARFRHAYVVGQTGTGKSTLLLNMATQDMRRGDGVAVLDPHGDLVEALLERVPKERLDDVVLVDPADEVAVVGVNLLEAESEVQRVYLVEELARMFQVMFDPQQQGVVGPRFETMLRQAAGLLMTSDHPASLLDVSTVFTDKAVRRALTANVEDPVLAEYWLGEMAMAKSNEWQEVMSWFRSKFEIFRTSQLVRNVVGQAESTISFGDVLRERRILLVNLSKGLLGEYNSALVGQIVLARLWAAALERASMPVSERHPFQIYLDEFQNMTNESLPSVLSEARKFGVGLTLANQFFTQIPEATRDAIMGNVGTRITFRLGPKDAEPFTPWLGRPVHPEDLTTLPNHVALAALSDAGVPLAPFALRGDRPAPSEGRRRAEAARARSRKQWGRPVESLDRDFFDRWADVPGSIASRLQETRSKQTSADTSSTPPGSGGSFLDSWRQRRDSGGSSSAPDTTTTEDA